MDNDLTNNNNVVEEKASKMTLEDIQKLLESNNVSVNDIEKINELKKFKKLKDTIINNLKKYENLLNKKKINSKKVIDLLTAINEMLYEDLPKKNKKKVIPASTSTEIKETENQ